MFSGDNALNRGLFGGTTNSSLTNSSLGTTGSLFGNTGTGLFGTQTNQQASTNSLFGSKPSTGLFGTSTTAQPSSPFGQTPALSGTNTLFGGSANAQPASTNLFAGATFGPRSDRSSTAGVVFREKVDDKAGGKLQSIINDPKFASKTKALIHLRIDDYLNAQEQGACAQSPTPGVFGANTSTTSGGGLFATNAGVQQPSNVGSLFGAQPQQQQGLFGNTPPRTGGLYGATASSPGQTGGLFGTLGQQNQQGGSGLFGTSTNASPGGGLFNSTTQTTGLFGQPTNANTSPFGQQQQQPPQAYPQTSSLFGNSTSGGGSLFGQTAGTSGTSLFGNAGQQPGGASLFGGTSTQQKPAGGGIFGSTGNLLGSGNTNTATTSGGGLFGNSTAGGMNSTTTGFGTLSNNVGGSLFGGGGSSTAPSTISGGGGLFGMSGPSASGGGLFDKPAMAGTTGLLGNTSQPQQSTTSAGGGLFGNTSSSSLFGNTSSLNGQLNVANAGQQNASGGLFGTTTQGGSLFGTSTNNATGGGLFGNTGNTGLFAPSQTQTHSVLFGKPMDSTSSGAVNPGIQMSTSAPLSNPSLCDPYNLGNLAIRNAAAIIYGTPAPATTTSGSSLITGGWERALLHHRKPVARTSYLDNIGTSSTPEGENVGATSRNSPCLLPRSQDGTATSRRNSRTSELGSSHIGFVALEDSTSTPKQGKTGEDVETGAAIARWTESWRGRGSWVKESSVGHTGRDEGSGSTARSTGFSCGVNPLAPKLTKTGYRCKPSIEAMQKYTEEALAQVEDFTIVRDNYGSILWPGLTDVRGLDIDLVVEIEANAFELYGPAWRESRRDGQVQYPPEGEGLNKRCVITLHGCRPSEAAVCRFASMEEAHNAHEKRLAKHTEDIGGKFISLSDDWTWKFQMERFVFENSDE